MYAIVDWRGKQYRVEAGKRVSLDRFQAEEGAEVELGPVLLLATDDGVQVGTPEVEDASVTARVVRHYRGRKGYGFKYKAKKRYSRRWGFRSELTEVLIERIEGAGLVSEPELEPEPEPVESVEAMPEPEAAAPVEEEASAGVEEAGVPEAEEERQEE